jgi:hypothetical protein
VFTAIHTVRQKRNFYFLFLSETAINIGYSCQLLTDEMEEVFIIDGEDEKSVWSSIREHMRKIRASSRANNSMENSLSNEDNCVSHVELLPGGCNANESQSNFVVENGPVSK